MLKPSKQHIQTNIHIYKKSNVILSTHLKEFKGFNYLEEIIYNKTTLKLDGCFIEIGTNPNSEFIQNIVKTNAKKEIKINFKTCETNTKGIFAAGDVTNTSFKQIIISAGQGAIAALSVNKHLKIQLNNYE